MKKILSDFEKHISHLSDRLENIVVLLTVFIYTIHDELFSFVNISSIYISDSLISFVEYMDYRINIFLNNVYNYKPSVYAVLLFIIISQVLIFTIIRTLLFSKKLYFLFKRKESINKLFRINFPALVNKIYYKDLFIKADHMISYTLFSILLYFDSHFGNKLPKQDVYKLKFKIIFKDKVFFKPVKYFYSHLKKIAHLKSTDEVYTENISDLYAENDENPVDREIISRLSGILSDSEKINIIPQSWKDLTEKLIERFNNDLPANILLTSSRSTGKTSFLSYLNSRILSGNACFINGFTDIFEKSPIKELSTLSSDELAEIEKQIIIIDDVEHLFKRTIGGFELLERLFILIEKTKSRILWAVSANDLFYNYIKYILPIDGIFNITYDFKDIDSSYIKQIFDRHIKSAGYSYKIIPDKKMKSNIEKQIRTKKLIAGEVDAYIKLNYFSKLYESGNKNIIYYKNYFLKSIVNFNSNKLYLKFPIINDFVYIKKLKVEGLLILYFIALHKSMTKKDLISTLLLPPQVVSLNLSLLLENGILEKNENAFTISNQSYNHVVKYLQVKNILG